MSCRTWDETKNIFAIERAPSFEDLRTKRPAIFSPPSSPPRHRHMKKLKKYTSTEAQLLQNNPYWVATLMSLVQSQAGMSLFLRPTPSPAPPSPPKLDPIHASRDSSPTRPSISSLGRCATTSALPKPVPVPVRKSLKDKRTVSTVTALPSSPTRSASSRSSIQSSRSSILSTTSSPSKRLEGRPTPPPPKVSLPGDKSPRSNQLAYATVRNFWAVRAAVSESKMQTLPDARSQTFEELYGVPENFLEVEVGNPPRQT